MRRPSACRHYSHRYNGDEKDFADVNYIRNAAVAVMDAYDGSVTFYVTDPSDPIIATYRNIFPGLFKSIEAMPANLKAHLRYPEKMFVVQAHTYALFHMSDPETFYNREDLWTLPPAAPYYVMAPYDTPKPEFMLMQAATIKTAGYFRAAGWLAGLSDGANYAKLVAYTFPKGAYNVDGPAQIEAAIQTQPTLSRDISLWDQRGSKYLAGNMLILPLPSGKMIYIEGGFIVSEKSPIPKMVRVMAGQVLANGLTLKWGDNLQRAMQSLVGNEEAACTVTAGAPGDTLNVGEVRQRVQNLATQLKALEEALQAK